MLLVGVAAARCRCAMVTAFKRAPMVAPLLGFQPGGIPNVESLGGFSFAECLE
jgi:hypothetical protein